MEIGDEVREQIRALFLMIENQQGRQGPVQEQNCPRVGEQQQISSPTNQDQCRPPPQQPQECAPQAPFPTTSPRQAGGSAQECAPQAPFPTTSPRQAEGGSAQECAPQAPLPTSPEIHAARNRAAELNAEIRQHIRVLYQAVEEYKQIQRQFPAANLMELDDGDLIRLENDDLILRLDDDPVLPQLPSRPEFPPNVSPQEYSEPFPCPPKDPPPVIVEEVEQGYRPGRGFDQGRSGRGFDQGYRSGRARRGPPQEPPLVSLEEEPDQKSGRGFDQGYRSGRARRGPPQQTQLKPWLDDDQGYGSRRGARRGPPEGQLIPLGGEEVKQPETPKGRPGAASGFQERSLHPSPQPPSPQPPSPQPPSPQPRSRPVYPPLPQEYLTPLPCPLMDPRSVEIEQERAKNDLIRITDDLAVYEEFDPYYCPKDQRGGNQMISPRAIFEEFDPLHGQEIQREGNQMPSKDLQELAKACKQPLVPTGLPPPEIIDSTIYGPEQVGHQMPSTNVEILTKAWELPLEPRSLHTRNMSPAGNHPHGTSASPPPPAVFEEFDPCHCPEQQRGGNQKTSRSNLQDLVAPARNEPPPDEWCHNVSRRRRPRNQASYPL